MKKVAGLLFSFVVFLMNSAFAFPISEGDKNEEVYNLQVVLIAAGILGDGADGHFGPKTKEAVMKAQKQFEFEETGAISYGLYNLILEYATKKGDAKNVQVGEEVKIGSKGPGVTEVQRQLQELHYYDGILDGVAGARTAVAIAKFQKRAGIWASGIADANTQNALRNTIERAGKRTLKMQATAYSPEDPGLNSRTATGTRVRKGVVAVDPNVIPLGTRMYIEGYGEAVAEDIGGSIKGNKIDIAFDTHREALMFGSREVTVTILD
ncbi:MAG: peptidoglycan-binding protein [Selenomonadaceae bacterium]|nr:peptidoglycan-binding protein [Selenomonadaceae bacterium]